MTHFALILTLGLLAVTAYLAWEGQQAARGAKQELAFVKSQQDAQETARPSDGSMITLPSAPATASITPPAPTPTPVPPPPALGGTLPGAPQEMAGASALPGGGLTVPKSVAAAEAAGVQTNTLMPSQQQVLTAKPLAKVKTVVKEQGFIVLDSGSKQQISKGMKLAVRRGGAILARVTVTDAVEETEAVADIDLASIPVGVSIEPGDELIEPVSR